MDSKIETTQQQPAIPAVASKDGFDDWPRTPDGRLLCSPEHPFPMGNGAAYMKRWAHTGAQEVGPQRDGWPCGDTVTMACKDCGLHWDSELPQ